MVNIWRDCKFGASTRPVGRVCQYERRTSGQLRVGIRHCVDIIPPRNLNPDYDDGAGARLDPVGGRHLALATLPWA